MNDRQLAETFVELADTLVDDFDVVDFLHRVPVRCADVLGVSAAGVLLTDQRGTLAPDTTRLGQALADVATIGLLQARASHHRDTLAEQLQTALNSRVIIEQAKGVIAERRRLDMEKSFTLLRSTARTSNLRLSDLARAVVDGSETLQPPQEQT